MAELTLTVREAKERFLKPLWHALSENDRLVIVDEDFEHKATLIRDAYNGWYVDSVNDQNLAFRRPHFANGRFARDIIAHCETIEPSDHSDY